MRSGRVRLLLGSEVREILDHSVRLRASDREIELPNDYVLVFAGGEPPFKFLRDVGVRFGGDEGSAPSPGREPS